MNDGVVLVVNDRGFTGQNHPVAVLEITDGVGKRSERNGVRAQVHLAIAIADGQRLGPQSRFKMLDFAFGAAALDRVAFQRRDACGIVAAIFKAFERIDQLLRDRTAPENADNAAHADQYLQSTKNAMDPHNENKIALYSIIVAD